MLKEYSIPVNIHLYYAIKPDYVTMSALPDLRIELTSAWIQFSLTNALVYEIMCRLNNSVKYFWSLKPNGGGNFE